jgi:protein-L-isoaspartate(D-aspartate) O-methyltransferase
MDKHERERRRMVRSQIERRGLKDPRLLAAFESVPRHRFVPENYRYAAYDDGPIPIGHSQTISQPYIVALMTALLRLKGDERVLEIGTGSGYQAAILGMLTDEVHTVEYLPELAAQADKLLKELGFDNVHVHVGDGSLGWPEAAPYAGSWWPPLRLRPQSGLCWANWRMAGGWFCLWGRSMQNLEIWTAKGMISKAGSKHRLPLCH